MTASVGIIGCGHIARFHARNLRDAINRHGADAHYLAACDRDLSRAEKFAEIGGCELVTRDADELIEACDIVYVCTETAEHPELVARAADAGCHVFCEKPLARDVATAGEMTARVVEAGITHQVGLALRTSPVYRVLASMMSEELGPLLAVHLRDDQFFPVRGHYGSSWRGDVERAGGGTLLEHSIHDVDLFRTLFGEITAVTCRTRETSGHPGIEDVATATFQHAGGHTTALTSVWHAIDSRGSSRCLEIFFERARFYTEHDYFGTLTMEIDEEQAVTLSNDEILARFMQLEGLSPIEEDLRSLAGLGDRRFLDAAIAGRPASPDFSEALASHQIVDACYRSAAEGGGIVSI